MISAVTINKLQLLLRGGYLPYSALSNSLRDELLLEQLLVVQSNGSHRKLYSPHPEALQSYLSLQYEELRELNAESLTKDYCSRAEQAYASGNSKLIYTRSCPGFMVNSLEPIEASINEKSFTIYPIDGTLQFISDWQNFNIPEDVIVVGVENMENFRLIRKQQYLFCAINSKILFVSRYPQSLDLRNWLMKIPNRYIHFGDFDIAGIHIYETEFKNFLGDRAMFFMPEDIEKRISTGSVERYDLQINRYKDYKPSTPDVQVLFKLIHNYRRAYDQEGYILK